jgi:ATP phosphoribosyltransferase regulatory subunit
MVKPPFPERQLPYGVADLFFEESARKSRVEAVLRETFDRWSYSEIIPPSFEYYEPLSSEASPQLREEIYRFFDRDGRTLALRADPTIPIARIVSTKLFDRQLPLRFFYVTNVFRYEEPKASLRREFTQAGVELIGTNTAAADAEVIALAVTALRTVGVLDFRLRVGTMGFISALLDELRLTPAHVEAIKLALERKSNPYLSEVLNGSQIRPDLRRALARLPELMGGAEILEIAERECAINDRTLAALRHLRGVHLYLQALGCRDAITYDLAMVRGMAYYTGVVFEGFAPGIGFSIMSGGRYDKLLSHFGGDLPALGFAIGVERTLAALAARGGPDVDLAPQIIAELSALPEMADRIRDARARGGRVELSLVARTREQLLAFARTRGADEVWFADGTVEVSR